MAAPPLRILMADDHPIVLAGLKALVQADPAFEIIGEARDGRSALRLAKELRIGEADVAFLVELAHAAGLVDVGGAQRDEWLPTRDYDAWREQDLTDRWAVLAWGWLTSTRLISLVGQRDVAGKAVNVLSPDVVRQTAPVLRRLAEEEGVEMPIVAAVDDLLAGRSDVDAVLERLLSRPLRPERA